MNRKTAKVFEGKDLEFYNLLLQTREQVCSQMQQYSESALDVSNADKRGVTTHMADISSDNSRHEMELQLLSEDGDVLKLIDATIERLHKGTYGKCLDCEQMIPEGRLKVRPYAIYCIKCKSKREEQMKY
ncbi:MAG: TraR/DksA family transcriptional regulator [Lentisphaeria bacterium]|nr:TraR/DksA family transcriptional regulator [Lentisphaeria bacterium]